MALWCRCRYPAIFIGVQDRALHGYTWGLSTARKGPTTSLSSAPKDPIYPDSTAGGMCFLSRLLRMGRHVAVILHLAFVASCLLNIPNLPDIIVIFLLG